MTEKKELKHIEFYTEKGGVNPTTRKGVLTQALAHFNLDLSNFEKVGDYLIAPVAVDFRTKETLYLKISASVGRIPTTKEKTPTAKVAKDIPSLF